MIHPDTIAEFISQPKDYHGWIKKVPEPELDEELARLGFKPAISDPPLDKHQKACAILGIAHPRFSFWLDMGTGKTRLILELLRYFSAQSQIRRVLILVPSEDGVWSWEEQIKFWNIGLDYIALGNAPTAEKWTQIEEMGNGLIIASYPGLQWLVSKIKFDKKQKRNRLNWNEKLINKLGAQIDAYVWDESTKLGNQDSLPSRICRKLSRNAPFVWALAGRPFGRDPTLVWNQQYLVDQGESLGDTLGLFRAGFFTEKRGYFKQYEYKFQEEKRDLLSDFMAHRSITYAESECHTLPGVRRIVERVRLPEDIEGYYKKAIAAFIAAKGNYSECKNIFLRLRQLSSGFVGFRDDETGERAQFVFPSNPKLDRLLTLIDAMPRDRKAIVFYEFTVSGRAISTAIEKELGIKCGWLWSGAKDRRTFQDRFRDDPKLRVAVVNNALGSHVLNLQSANYEYFFESPVDPISREQAEHRAFRKGQTRAGFLYDLVVRGTKDEDILKMLAKGEDVFQAIMRNPRAMGLS